MADPIIRIHTALTRNSRMDMRKTDYDINKYFDDPHFIKYVHVETIALNSLGNKYLLRSLHFDKILEWLVALELITYEKSIMCIVNNISSKMVFTYETLWILFILYEYIIRDCFAEKKRESILPVAEQCIINITNFNISDFFLAKNTAENNISPRLKIREYQKHQFSSVLTELLLSHISCNFSEAILLLSDSFIILESDRFTKKN